MKFRDWFDEKLSDYADDIANHGADGGFPYLTYTCECAAIFDRFAEEIWDMAYEDSLELGYKNVFEMISQFGRVDMAQSIDGLKNLMLWYAAEKVAHEVQNEKEAA